MLAREHDEELLILVKTYPQPSTAHRETTCVAAVTRQNDLRRVFPVPFRLLEGQSQFRKWEWIEARVRKAEKDHRPESFRIDVDTIRRGASVGTRHEWRERRQWIEPHIVESFATLEQRRLATGETLGVIRPAEILGLDITAEKSADWTREDKDKLSRDCLFDSEQIRQRVPLRKLPIAIHYRYKCTDGSEWRHRVTDWEIGALYWNCLRSHGPQSWERPFREKLERELPSKDLMFLMGTIHRFPDHWLVVGLIYPPKPKLVGQTAMSFE
jgi:hypothetical protein